MRWLAIAAVLALSGGQTATAAARVASAGLCADQAVVALVPRQDIVGLSHQARDPALSAVAAAAATLPTLRPSAEAILMSGADTVAADAFGDAKAIGLVRRIGVHVVRVPHADDFATVTSALTETGAALGAPAAAAALNADLERRLARLPAAPPTPPSALYLRPDGGSAGGGTAIDAAMRAAGLRNHAAALGQQGWIGLDLETLVLSPPEVLVTSTFDQGGALVRETMLRHPAGRRLMADIPRIEVPMRLWSCGGWPLVAAAERIAAARSAPASP